MMSLYLPNWLEELSDEQAEVLQGGGSFPDQANPPDFVDAWHGFGPDHQANNNPGDTASDRHNFDGNPTPSGHVPTDGSNG
jgi:hypothetical protein